MFNDEENNSSKEVLLLGELLKSLRKDKQYSCLMICRKINKLIITENSVKIDIDDNYKEELLNNEKNISLLTSFFKSKNLDYKIDDKMAVEDEIDKLNFWLGGKLIIKSIKNV